MESPSRTKIPHLVIVAPLACLPMLYTLRELGEELGIPDSTLRDWLVAGAPHQRDSRDHLWVMVKVLPPGLSPAKAKNTSQVGSR
jgi:hypothetical protein